MNLILQLAVLACAFDASMLAPQTAVFTYSEYRTATVEDRKAALSKLATSRDVHATPTDLGAVLNDAFVDRDRDVRKRALTLFASRVGGFRFGGAPLELPESQNELQALAPLRSSVVALLDDPDAGVRDAAVMALGNLDAAQTRSSRTVTLDLPTVAVFAARYKRETDPTVRASIVQGLALASNVDAPLRAVIIAAMGDSSAEVRQFAARGTRKLEPSIALPLLVNALSDPDRGVRLSTAQTISQFGAAASHLTTVVLDAALAEKDPLVKAELQRTAEVIRYQ